MPIAIKAKGNVSAMTPSEVGSCWLRARASLATHNNQFPPVRSGLLRGCPAVHPCPSSTLSSKTLPFWPSLVGGAPTRTSHTRPLVPWSGRCITRQLAHSRETTPGHFTACSAPTGFFRSPSRHVTPFSSVIAISQILVTAWRQELRLNAAADAVF